MPKAKKLYPFEEDERLLKLSEVSLWLGVAPSSIHNWIKAGHFPKPVVLGDPKNPHAAVRFRKHEVVEWINGRPREKETTDIFGAQARGESQQDFSDMEDEDDT
jgi:predicted DNA-binding transcriptional regulator AlpA